MKTFKVVHEITVVAKNSLEAAKTIQEWMDNADTKWQFYVQEAGSKKIDSIDLNEDDSVAIQPVKNYKPMIKR
jgi:hypothetical protein